MAEKTCVTIEINIKSEYTQKKPKRRFTYENDFISR